MLCEYGIYGSNLGQKGVVTRFLAKELGYVGMTTAEEARLDALHCFWFSTLQNNGSPATTRPIWILACSTFSLISLRTTTSWTLPPSLVCQHLALY